MARRLDQAVASTPLLVLAVVDEPVRAESSWASSFCIRSAAAVEPDIRLAKVVVMVSEAVAVPCPSSSKA